MKTIIKVIAVTGMMFLVSGCSTSSQSLNGMNGSSCNNPKCQCPKPCQCGSNCKCGTNGNSTDMSSN